MAEIRRRNPTFRWPKTDVLSAAADAAAAADVVVIIVVVVIIIIVVADGKAIT